MIPKNFGSYLPDIVVPNATQRVTTVKVCDVIVKSLNWWLSHTLTWLYVDSQIGKYIVIMQVGLPRRLHDLVVSVFDISAGHWFEFRVPDLPVKSYLAAVWVPDLPGMI